MGCDKVGPLSYELGVTKPAIFNTIKDMKRKILLDVLSCKPPDALYHYTTQSGFLGIIKSKEIWATHTQYLNDQREYLHALEIVREEIEAVREVTTDSRHKALLKDMADDVNGIESMNICICSFSEDKDSLSQWRAYSAASSGFAIGFTGKLLAEVTTIEKFYLAPCIYDRSKQRELIRALVEEVLEQNIDGTPWDDKHHFPKGGSLCAYLHRYAPILKDPSFKEEREWRIISTPLANSFERFGFRAGSSMLIPYYRFPLSDKKVPFAVHEIVVGPTPHPGQALRSTSSFLVSQKLRDVPVINSAVPYRSW